MCSLLSVLSTGTSFFFIYKLVLSGTRAGIRYHIRQLINSGRARVAHFSKLVFRDNLYRNVHLLKCWIQAKAFLIRQQLLNWSVCHCNLFWNMNQVSFSTWYRKWCFPRTHELSWTESWAKWSEFIVKRLARRHEHKDIEHNNENTLCTGIASTTVWFHFFFSAPSGSRQCVVKIVRRAEANLTGTASFASFDAVCLLPLKSSNAHV